MAFLPEMHCDLLEELGKSFRTFFRLRRRNLSTGEFITGAEIYWMIFLWNLKKKYFIFKKS